MSVYDPKKVVVTWGPLILDGFAEGDMVSVAIDVQRTAMWLQNQVQTAVFNAQISREKVPFDDSGIQYLANAVRGVLAAAKDAGVLASDREFSVTPPRSADISAANKTARVLSPAITANAILSGALHYAQVSITLS